ncbi:uncharacterized protein [Drosophila kikkawai]|uniref:Uncharacterized protein LOC108080183 n=1 Tax=Drosophila kikkawai TaxID=30033 RepID=A0A6P4J6Z9_DROKI|nr:uncharacterized protein LOC108080183 [Drosophila kikkawai]XP_017030323.1 uncharacterized protein LOC108080183 [Drosophila kikkawai]KAH8303387.1 hypothetical protein KR059_009732 [Drosophila kikkawai]
MLKHASNASSAAAIATAIAVPVTVPPTVSASGGAPLGGGGGGQLLRTASVIVANSSSSTNNISCNGNSNSNSNGSGSGHNTPPVGIAGTGTGAAAGASGATTTNGGSGGSPTPAAAAVASTARNIHLRPPQPQPLNISALNASAASTSTLLNGGARVANGSTLLNIATPITPLKPLTPLTPLTPNGHCLGNGSVHHHTYTNQHILASSSQQQQQQQSMHQPMHQHHHPSHTQSQHQSQAPIQMQQSQTQAHHLSSQVPHNYSHCNNLTTNSVFHKLTKPGPSPREALTSLGLLCLISLLLALLSLIFLLRISPTGREDAVGRGGPSSEDFILVYDVTLALGALSLSLNLCCLLVCAIQFLFAVKLRAPAFEGRDNQYLAKSSVSRTCAVSGFFISIPVFLTGLILYTFSHFHSTPAIVTSILIGVGIVFCGGAMVHNVFVWQHEKTISYRSAPLGLSQLLTPPTASVPPLSHNLSLLSAAQLPVQLPVPLPLPLPPANGYHTASPAVPQPQLYQGHHACLLQPPSVTPVSPNHSHGSFNPLLSGGNLLTSGGAVNSSFLVRPATATPPTPRPGNSSCLTTATAVAGRDACGSVSPGIPPTLDMSNMTISLHELSTLV